MSMISQAIEVFIGSLLEIFISEGPTTFGARMKQVLDAVFTMLLAVIPEVLERMDGVLAEDEKRKAEWEIVRMDKRTLVTAVGDLCFRRRYYRHKGTGEMAYLLDRRLGIQASAKVNGDVRQRAIVLSEQVSYSKSAADSTISDISRMSVCNYIKDLGSFPVLEAEGKKRSVRNIYVEADEDHVALQEGKNAQVKLIYIHEGVVEHGDRRQLINPRYLTWPQGRDIDTLWETVSTYIDQQYVSEEIENVFLSGDCAPWIRAGEEWLYPCVPILDTFHSMKALRGLCGGNQRRASLFLHHVWADERARATELCQNILVQTPAASREAKRKQAQYLLGNWQRIRNQRHPDAAGCSAEGHVSHILSARLSSRPCGWSRENMENIAQLRVMKANGQVIQYDDLVRRKSQKEGYKSLSKADALVKTQRIEKALKKSVRSYVEETRQNLPVLRNGKATPIYNALKGLSLGHLAC